MNAPAQRSGEGECLVPLGNGHWLTVGVTAARQQGGLERIKADGEEARRLAERLREVIELAQHGERDLDLRWRSRVRLSCAPQPGDRAWELAAVLADRIARGVWLPTCARVVAVGQSDDWLLGRLAEPAGESLPGRLDMLLARDLSDALLVLGAGPVTGNHVLATRPAASLVIKNVLVLGSLAELSGHPDPAAFTRTASAWFPVVAGDTGSGDDQLVCLRVSVRPRSDGETAEDESVAVTGIPDARRRVQDCGRVLEQSRLFDRAAGRWVTGVRFERGFTDDSFELALVIADRMARGREVFPTGHGRLIATGCSSRWHQGIVDTVKGEQAKCALIARDARLGDRILVPAAWRRFLPGGFAEKIRSKGATVAAIERIA